MNRAAALAGLVLVVLVLAAPLAALLSAGGFLAAVAVLVVIALVAAAVARRRRDEDDGSASVWAFIPSWQYGGRHVESGGLARGEQERALGEIREQAAKRDAGEVDTE
jgi:cytochrome c biogenesis protein ResB